MSVVRNWLMKLIKYLCATCLIVMATILLVQVIARYVFNRSIYWAEELAIYCMIWSIFLGSAIGVAEKSHTRIGFFINLFPAVVVNVIQLILDVIFLFFAGVLGYNSLSIVEISMKSLSAGLRLPLGFVYGSLSVSALLMVIFFLFNIVDDIRTFSKPISEGENKV